MKESEQHFLKEVWDRFPSTSMSKDVKLPPLDLRDLEKSLFSVGDYYYFKIHFHDQSVHFPNKKICNMLGLEQIPKTFNDVLELINKDDIGFVKKAEALCIEKVELSAKLSPKNVKTSYCFRMRMPNGNYHLFHHQSIVTDIGPNNEVLRSIVIHTDVHHLANKNNYTVSLIAANGDSFYWQVNLTDTEVAKSVKSPLTARETEIVRLIAKGLASSTIAEMLNIATQTVRVHRKNILRKTQTTNSGSLIATCVKQNWV